MENYFQAEAFNLDKVLDEFEQNEGPLPLLLSHTFIFQGFTGFPFNWFILFYWFIVLVNHKHAFRNTISSAGDQKKSLSLLKRNTTPEPVGSLNEVGGANSPSLLSITVSLSNHR